MPATYPPEMREEAAELYVVDGLTQAQISARIGVSENQLSRWSQEEDWKKKRSDYRRQMTDIRRNTLALRRALLQKAMESLDPQDVYALARLEQVAAKSERPEESAPPPQAEPARKIENPADAVAAVREAVEGRVNAMLSGQMDLKGLKDLKAALDLWEKLDAANQPEEPQAETRKGVSPEVIEQIKRDILGIAD